MTATVGASEAAAGRGVVKSPAAFRTIAEVATELDLPAHVLRFWESKFPQIKPLKRRGGRRYYRPEDVALLRRIRGLLYTDGYTIKGVQRLLRESGGRGGVMAIACDEQEPGGNEADAAGDSGGDAETGLSDVAAAAPSAADAPATRSGGAADLLRRALTDLEAMRALLRKHGY